MYEIIKRWNFLFLIFLVLLGMVFVSGCQQSMAITHLKTEEQVVREVVRLIKNQDFFVFSQLVSDQYGLEYRAIQSKTTTKYNPTTKVVPEYGFYCWPIYSKKNLLDIAKQNCQISESECEKLTKVEKQALSIFLEQCEKLNEANGLSTIQFQTKRGYDIAVSDKYIFKPEDQYTYLEVSLAKPGKDDAYRFYFLREEDGYYRLVKFM